MGMGMEGAGVVGGLVGNFSGPAAGARGRPADQQLESSAKQTRDGAVGTE